MTVNFKEKVLDLPIGKRNATISDIQSDFQEVIKYFEDLSKRYGEISLYKQIPPAKWGDVWRRNRRTGEMVQIHEWSQLFSIRFPQLVPIDEIIAELEKLAAVEYAHQPVQVMPLSDGPNDTFYNSTDQWNLFKIEAEKAWDITHGSSDIVVAVIDAGGFQPSHVDLRNKFVEGNWDTTGTGGIYENHGTEVSGVIAAETNNQNGIASLGWNIMMIPYAFFQYDTLQLVDHIYSAKSYPVNIINCSFVLLKGSCPAGLDDYVDVKDIIADAINQGIIVVAGTGNRAYHECDFPFVPCPAAYADVIGVAATDKNDEHPDGYNYKGPEMLQFIDVAAPGDSIKTTHDFPNVYDEIDGTSVAAPHVSALAGLILSINPDLTPSDVENIIKVTAKDLVPEKYFGEGRINAYEALRYTLENYGGTLSGNVLLHGDLTIKSGATLVIESGTTITFAANQDDQSSGLDNTRCELTIQGKIEADTVTFTSSSSSANSWYGIVLDGAASTSYIKNSTIKWAKRGIIVDDCSPTIQGNDLDHNQYGIWVHGSSSNPMVKENDINNGSLPLVVSSNADAHIYDNKSRGLEKCLYVASGGYPEVLNNTLYGYTNGKYQVYIIGSSSGIRSAQASGDGNYFTDDVIRDIVQIDGGSYFYFCFDVFENVSSTSYDYIDNNDATWCVAEYCYWDNGGVPSSSYFDGNVDYTPVLASEPSAGVTWKLIASNPSPFEDGFQAYKNKNYEYAASELKTVFENNYDHEDAHRALFYISRSAMRISEKTPYLTFFEDIIKSLYDEESKQIARSALMRHYARSGQLSKSESYAMAAPRGMLYDRELLLDMVYYYSLYEDKVGEARVISVLTEVYGDDKSIEEAIKNVKLLVEDERKLMKMSPAGEGPASSGAVNASNENLLTAFPNPFNPSTTIRFTLNEPGNVTLKIYNIKGQQVALLVNGHKEAGVHDIVFNTTDLPSGVYFYHLSGKDINVVKKIMLIR